VLRHPTQHNRLRWECFPSMQLYYRRFFYIYFTALHVSVLGPSSDDDLRWRDPVWLQRISMCSPWGPQCPRHAVSHVMKAVRTFPRLTWNKDEEAVVM
jgi:hypothetical protein